MTSPVVDEQQRMVEGAVDMQMATLVARINDEIVEALRAQGGDAASVIKSEERESLGSFICFELAGKIMAIPLPSVLEAGNLHLVQSLPLLPDWLTGITNLRGEIVSVVHLGRFLETSELKDDSEVPPYLVIKNNDIKVAITVDKILGTRSLLRPTDENVVSGKRKQETRRFSEGWACYVEDEEEKMIALFDLNGFLSSDRLQNLATAKS